MALLDARGQSVAVLHPTWLLLSDDRWVKSSSVRLSLERTTRPRGHPLEMSTMKSYSTSFSNGCYGRVIVTVLLPASLPVVSFTKTLNEATSPEFSKPAVVSSVVVPAGMCATTVAVAASNVAPSDI